MLFMAKSTIFMAMFNSYVNLPEGIMVNLLVCHHFPIRHEMPEPHPPLWSRVPAPLAALLELPPMAA